MINTIRRHPRRYKRGSVLLITLTFALMFASLASLMVAFSLGNMQVQRAETNGQRALAAAESGMSFLRTQFRQLSLPVMSSGSVAAISPPSKLWTGTAIDGFANNNGVALLLTSALNTSGAISGPSLVAPTGTNPLVTPAIVLDPAGDGATFTLSVSWDSTNPMKISGTNTYAAVLHCKSTGTAGNTSRSVTMDMWVTKTLKYAIYSNVAIQLGKNVRVVGDIASTYNGTNKGPPVQMFSDFHYLSNMGVLDQDLANFRSLLNTYDSTYSNRLDVRNPSSPGALAAKAAGYADVNGDGFIDEYDLALNRVTPSWNRTNPSQNTLSQSQFTDPATTKLYDTDLWTLLDSPMGAVSPTTGLLPNGSSPPWSGYGDGVINSQDAYAKISGTVKMAITYSQWQTAATGWQQWGDLSGGTAGTNFRDQFEGPVISSDPTESAVQFGADFGSDQTLTPQSFNTSSYDSQIPAVNATKTVSGGTTTIAGGTLTAAMANGGTATEHSPASATSGWQATYQRPVFTNVTFNNVRIPKGLNAKFVNCTFNGYTDVKLNTTITDTSTGATTSDPSKGMTWAQQMTSGSFNANTALTSANSVAFQQGNNLHFSGCTFNGVLTADIPSAYTHFADSWEFDGATSFNNQVDQTVTIMAPNTNIEMGSYVDPSGNPSTLVGVVVAGNIDIRGTANVDGSLLVTGNGATNTTLGYFGSTDQGQAVPSPSQLPASANGNYGHLFFRYNPTRGMPNGITLPVVALPQMSTYQIQP